MTNPSVSIVLPCLNEARTVGRCVDRALQCLKVLRDRYGIGGEVVVADNGSTDGSVAVSMARGARVVHVAEPGYGAALQEGFRAASGEYLVMGDSDCSYDFLEAVGMVEALMKGADVCMGSRFKGRILPGAMPWKNRYIGNPILSIDSARAFPGQCQRCPLRHACVDTFRIRAARALRSRDGICLGDGAQIGPARHEVR